MLELIQFKNAICHGWKKKKGHLVRVCRSKLQHSLVYYSSHKDRPPIRTHQVTELPEDLVEEKAACTLFTLHGAKHRKVESIMVILQVKTLNWIWKLMRVLL